jgi:hypothetical protein
VTWTEISAKHNISSADALKMMAEISQLGQRGAGLLSEENRAVLLSQQEKITRNLPKELQQTGGAEIMRSLSASPASDQQKAMFMNQWLTPEGGLNDEGRKLATRIFKPAQLARLEEEYGPQSGLIISKLMAESGAGAGAARVGLSSRLEAAGVPKAFIPYNLHMNEREYALGAPAWRGKGWEDIMPSLLKADEDKLKPKVKGPEEAGEIELAKYQEVVTRLSGLTQQTANALQDLNKAYEKAKREFVNTADKTRNEILNMNKPVDPALTPFKPLINIFRTHRE